MEKITFIVVNLKFKIILSNTYCESIRQEVFLCQTMIRLLNNVFFFICDVVEVTIIHQKI
jgi:hypothetical protein